VGLVGGPVKVPGVSKRVISKSQLCVILPEEQPLADCKTIEWHQLSEEHTSSNLQPPDGHSDEWWTKPRKEMDSNQPPSPPPRTS
jgi:hypothetical protein